MDISIMSVGAAIISTDLDGQILEMNRLAESLTGWSSAEAVGMKIGTVFNVINESTGEALKDPVKRILKEQNIVEYSDHIILIKRDGTRRYIRETGAPVKDDNQVIVGVLFLFRDITEEQKAEAEMRKEEKLQSIGLLAGGIAHDFNNYLGSIVGYCALLKTIIEETPDNINEIVSIIDEAEDATYHAKKLTNQLLTFAKGGRPVKKAGSINTIVISTAKMLMSGSDYSFSLDIDEQSWQCHFDEDHFQQVLHSLFLNAKEAMPGGGRIEISIKNVEKDEISGFQPEHEKYIKLTIRDNGQGITGENIKKIFDPYFTTKKSGHGLGLAAVYSIINKHEGKIQVDSTPGEGATFTIFLPACIGESEEERRKRERRAHKRRNENGGNKDQHKNDNKAENKNERPKKGKNALKSNCPDKNAQVLILDDDDKIRKVMQQLLEMKGYTVVSVESGTKAVDIYRDFYSAKKRFDAVIIDLTNPGDLDGEEVLNRMLTIDPSIKAIASSGYANAPIMSDFEAYGFKNVLRKPFKMEELLSVLDEVILDE